jgi:hypothetical protein
MRRAASLTAGQLCTTSPSDDVLTKRILTGLKLEWGVPILRESM